MRDRTRRRGVEPDEALWGAGRGGGFVSASDWGTEQIVRTYWRLTEIEATFRSLKTELGLRPIWHVKHSRIAAHLFLAVLAYHAVHLIRTRLKARNIPLSWDGIRTRLRPWVRMTTTIRETNGLIGIGRMSVLRPSWPGSRGRWASSPTITAGAPAGDRTQTHKRSASLLAPGFVRPYCLWLTNTERHVLAKLGEDRRSNWG